MISIEDHNNKIVADQNLAVVKDGLLGGPFGEMASQPQEKRKKSFAAKFC